MEDGFEEQTKEDENGFEKQFWEADSAGVWVPMLQLVSAEHDSCNWQVVQHTNKGSCGELGMASLLLNQQQQ